MYISFTDWESCLHLAHHGIRGMKWGVRRYQNEDGTLTTLGKIHAGKEGRADNRALKKAISDQRRYGKEWRKERSKAIRRADKDDDYRKSIADLEAHRLNMDPEETKQFYDGLLAGERAADNIMWYKYGDRSQKNMKTQIEKGEQIAKRLINKLEKKGVSVSENGKRWQEGLEKERGEPKSGKDAFEGQSAQFTLQLMQAQRKIEKERAKKSKRHRK